MKTLFKSSILLLCCFSYVVLVQASLPIREIYSFTEAYEMLRSTTPESLVFFDIDDTIVTSPDMLPRAFRRELPFKDQVMAEFPELCDPVQLERLYSLVVAKSPQILVEEEVIPLITALKKRKVSALGCTFMGSGVCGVIPHMPTWRIKTLEELKVVFSKDFPDQIYDRLEKRKGMHPTLFKGVLCANLLCKGATIEAFMDINNVKPDQIVMFDDSFEHLKSVGRMCQQQDIFCTLFHYKGAEKFEKQMDAASVIKQIGILLNEDKWVSDYALEFYYPNF